MVATATDVQSSIRDVLERLRHAYEAKDLEGVLTLVAAGDHPQLVGTAADEVALDREAIRRLYERDFSQSDRLALSYENPTINSAGDVAWALVPCVITGSTGGQDVVINARLTAVFERSGVDWLVRQLHVSVPDAALAPGEAWPTR
jgi:ketosteroid isomerase-like protein